MKTKTFLSRTPSPGTTARHLRTACATRILPLLLLFALPAAVQAQCYTYITNKGAITITGYTCSDPVVIIPDIVNGLPVTRIENWAFASRSSLSVTIPNSVTNIGMGVFYSCTGLTNVTISSVTSIGDSAFAYCSSLATITVDTNNSSYSSIDGVLFNKNRTTLIEYPEGKPGSYTIPNSVTNIVDFAFSYCTKLTNVSIPASVTRLTYATFGDCGSLTTITVDPNNPSYSSLDGVLFNKTRSTLIKYPEAKAGSYTIPTTVTNISYGAFKRCTRLTNVTIPNSVTTIAGHAFDSCSSLTTLAIPNSVANLGDGAFVFCDKLASVTLPNRIPSILGYTFHSCGSLTNITIPNSVTSIGNWVFCRCTNLTSVTIPNSVTSIGTGVFAFCSRLTGVTIPNSLTTIPQFAFSRCTSLNRVTLGNSVTTIGFHAFEFCDSLTSITIPTSVTILDHGVFNSCSTLAGVYFKGNAPIAGQEVFSPVNAFVYYLPGTIGWSNSFAGLPTAIWHLPYPVILGSTEYFGFRLSWATNATVVVEASTNLSSWTPVVTHTITMGVNPLTDGWSYFSDPDWESTPARFYRLRSP